jgi:hypothetical protein
MISPEEAESRADELLRQSRSPRLPSALASSTMRSRLLLVLVLVLIWSAPMLVTFIMLRGHYFGAHFDERTRAGQFERNEHAVFFCALVIAGALWLSISKWHNRERLYWFSGFAIATAIWDSFYFSSLFGVAMFVLALAANILASGTLTRRSTWTRRT